MADAFNSGARIRERFERDGTDYWVDDTSFMMTPKIPDEGFRVRTVEPDKRSYVTYQGQDIVEISYWDVGVFTLNFCAFDSRSTPTVYVKANTLAEAFAHIPARLSQILGERLEYFRDLENYLLKVPV